MRYIFKFPDIGEGISEGRILKWYVDKGHAIRAGDPVVQMETDKVVADIPSPRAGVIVARFGHDGDIVKVEDPLVEIEIEGVAGAEAQAVAREKPVVKTEEPVEEQDFGVVGKLEVAGNAAFLPASDEGVPSPPAPPVAVSRALATPVARAIARELGVDLQRVSGTGPGGRVMKSDIQSYHDARQEDRALPPAPPPAPSPAAVPAGAAVEYEPLSQIRKTIARNMSVSKQTAAHMTVIEEVEISALAALRRSQKERFAARGTALTYLSFILRAAAAGLRRHKSLNSRLELEKNRLAYFRDIHIGIAVDTDDGLVVPVIRDADRLSIHELAVRIADLSGRARERRLTLDDLKDGTFTVTNYGAIGGLFGVPVINYPQAAILGIGRIHEKPVVRAGQIVPGTVLPLSLSVDHRIVDGGEATRFLIDVMDCLRDPVSMLLG